MISIDRIIVDKGRMTALVSLPVQDAYSTPERMRLVLAEYPRLQRHSCVNSKGPTFADVMNETSWAHVLEHLVIDLQVSAHQQAGDVRDPWFVGNTQWVDKASGKARVQVNFFDDFIAMRSFRDAVRFLNSVISL